VPLTGDVESAFQEADAALYRAKDLGRDRVAVAGIGFVPDDTDQPSPAGSEEEPCR